MTYIYDNFVQLYIEEKLDELSWYYKLFSRVDTSS